MQPLSVPTKTRRKNETGGVGTQIIAFRCMEGTKERLEELADQEMRSMGSIARMLINEALENRQITTH